MHQPSLIPVLLDGIPCYQLAAPWRFSYNGEEVIIPVNYVTDGASVPRMAWWFMPPDGLHRAAALEHDWMYDNKGEIDPGCISREDADLWFHSRMIEAGSSKKSARLAYLMIRAFGDKAWRDEKNLPIISLRPLDRISPMMAKSMREAGSAIPITPRHIYENIA